MKIRETVWTPRKAGKRVRPGLLRKLRRLHPRIRLVYSPANQRWGLMELCLDGRPRLVKAIDGQPTYRNTIADLNDMVTGSMSMGDVDAWEQRMIEDDEKAGEMSPEAADLVREGSDRLWRVLSPDYTAQIPRPKR